jgi:hypothetical protein
LQGKKDLDADEKAITAFIERYITAWESSALDEIADLFTETADYRTRAIPRRSPSRSGRVRPRTIEVSDISPICRLLDHNDHHLEKRR